jgi:hypothetical protein
LKSASLARVLPAYQSANGAAKSAFGTPAIR